MKRVKFCVIVCWFFLIPVQAAEIEKIRIVNGSFGGGWELTAKLTGSTLVSLDLVNQYKIETLEGGAGWRALEMFIAEDIYKEDMLIQSEPLLSGFLKKMYRKGVQDLRPVALVAAEYSCVVVAIDSPYQSFSDLLTVLKSTPERVPVSLGGRRGAGDHITANMIFKAAGIEKPAELRYVFSNGGDSAAIRHLKQGKNIIGVSGYNSIIAKAVENNEIRIIGVTSKESLDGHMSLKSQGVDIEYANWRGFFARKDISQERFIQYQSALKAMTSSATWQTVVKQNGWSSFYKSGDELALFLKEHEEKLKSTMQSLDLIK